MPFGFPSETAFAFAGIRNSGCNVDDSEASVPFEPCDSNEHAQLRNWKIEAGLRVWHEVIAFVSGVRQRRVVEELGEGLIAGAFPIQTQ